jgi:glycosyltransferase involved in cell wall biosynthesis
LPSDVPVIGHLANLSREKGTIDLVQAAQRRWDAGQPLHLLLAGPAMPNFRSFLGKLPGSHRRHLTLTGPLLEAEKPDFYAACAAFALPSYSDSFGLVLLEAWANAVPCVGYRCGGIAEVIKHDIDGLLAPAGNVGKLAEQLKSLLEDWALARRLGVAGRVKVLANHRWPDKLAVVHDHMKQLT